MSRKRVYALCALLGAATLVAVAIFGLRACWTSGDAKPGNAPVFFARHGKTWAAVWKETDRERKTRHVDKWCYNRLQLTVLDAKLSPVLSKAIRVLKRPCRFVLRYNVFATDEGYGVVYFTSDLDGTTSPTDPKFPGQVGCAFYRVEKNRVVPQKRQCAFPQRAETLSHDGLVKTQLTVAYQQQRLLLAQIQGGQLRLRSSRDGQPARQVLAVDKQHPDNTFTAADLVHGPPLLLAYFEQKPVLGPGQVRYVFAADGRKTTSSGILFEVPDKDAVGLQLRVLRDASGYSVYVKMNKAIWRRRVTQQGALQGKPEKLLSESGDLFNFNAANHAGRCVLLYTVGNDKQRLFTCRDRKKRKLPSGYAATLFCAGGQCLRASQSDDRVKIVDFVP